MAPLKFCANISWLFTELPDLSQRIVAAAAAGFRAVEAAWPYDSDLQELQRVRKATGVEVVLLNTPPGDVKAGDLGLGAVPGREAEFREGLDLSLKYARALDCKRSLGLTDRCSLVVPQSRLRAKGGCAFDIVALKLQKSLPLDFRFVDSVIHPYVQSIPVTLFCRIHLMAGRVPADSDRATVTKEMEAVFVQNLKYAADILSKEGITALIEPINTRITDPRYFLESPHQASAILEKVGKPNLKLQMDIFHWQIMDGNLTQNIQKYISVIGHVQIAQVPGRNEPDSDGELSYNYLFNTLENLGYQGYIGCEYKPLGSTDEGLGWIKEYWTHRKC